MPHKQELSLCYRNALNSPFWMFFYGFFIISFSPYFVVRLMDQKWLYDLLYTPHGIIENMTVVLYVACLSLFAWFFFRKKINHISVLMVAAVALFMLGEETRWGIGFFVDDLHDVYISGMQDVLFFAAKGAPSNFPVYLVMMLYVVRLILFAVVCGALIAGWYYRHHANDVLLKIRQYPFSAHIIMYGILMLGVIILELFLQPGPANFSYIEETFELNAAIIWLSLCYEVGMLAYSQKQFSDEDL